MTFLKKTFVLGAAVVGLAMPAFAQEAANPNGKFVDSFGTSFEFQLCGAQKKDLCGVLTTLKGASATKENLAFVGKQVMQARQVAPGKWKGSLSAGGMSAEATVTQVNADTIAIQGCRGGIFCQTLEYSRS